MKTILKKSILGLGFLSIVTATCLWIHAQETAGSDSSVPGDKWEQVKKNNQDMLQSIEAIEQNLNFIKARSMSGGRSS